MTKIRCLIIYGLMLMVATACKKMDSIYKDFIVPGGLTYTGKVVAPMAYVGHNRIKISWLRGSDPSVTKAKIFWNNYTDSAAINVPPTGDTISYIIDNLPEQSYSFMILTYDNEGHSSVPVEVLSAVYGDKYQSSLLNRPVTSSNLDNTGLLTIQWGAADISNGAYAVDIRYTDTTGKIRMQAFPLSESTSTISDYKPGTVYQYMTAYLPDSLAIDTFYTAPETAHVTMKIDKSKWSATASSYEKTAELPNGPPEKAIDNDVNTYWHSDYTQAQSPNYPYWLAVDFKDTITVVRVELTSRARFFSSDFTEFTIQGSMDGETWTDYGTFNLADKADPQSFDITGTPTLKYIRIYMTKGPQFYTHLAEFSVYGY